MNEFKKMTMLFKGLKALPYFGIVIKLSTVLSGIILAKAPGTIDFINSLGMGVIIHGIGINELDKETFPILVGFIIISIVAMIINWWKRVFVPWFKSIDVSFFIKKKQGIT